VRICSRTSTAGSTPGVYSTRPPRRSKSSASRTPEVRMLYDAYTPRDGRRHHRRALRINSPHRSRQIADVPDATNQDRQLNWHDLLESLCTVGWEGALGLEYWPITETSDRSPTYARCSIRLGAVQRQRRRTVLRLRHLSACTRSRLPRRRGKSAAPDYDADGMARGRQRESTDATGLGNRGEPSAAT